MPSALLETEHDFYALSASQQPDWNDHTELSTIRTKISQASYMIDPAHVDQLRLLLGDVAAGNMKIIQAGDCAEDPADRTPDRLSWKIGLIQAIAHVMRVNTGKPVLCVGRIAGQFAKPRSAAYEVVDGLELPSYRGPLVNRPEPDTEARRHDPSLLLKCHEAAAAMTSYLNGPEEHAAVPLLWTSHEALVLDYELPQLHRFDERLLLTSAHWPWVGERTRHPLGAHVALLSAIANPVASKVGPDATETDLLELCGRLDPRREPGRLTLIARMGPVASETLPPLVGAVRKAGHPAIWLCDPMHGNTVQAPGSRKTRFVEAITQEVRTFQEAVVQAGGVAGGLHLEATPDPVTECVADETELEQVGRRYTSLCDPRLNPRQAVAVAAEWITS
ncbi:MAG: 3-deoxy-7-phosphoheptulonate synthase [Streptosporangiaceae bacterium]|jgi:3-deoxy-7-phosphoheptulonate synthase